MIKRLLVSLGLVALSSAPALASPPGSGWTWKWGDEFNYSGTPKSSIWSTCYWFGCNNGGAKEQQWFTSKNTSVSSGTLKLTAKRENSNGYSWTSGMISSANKYSFKYGYIEFRAKLPAGNGLWPCLWLASTRAWPPEVDVAEAIGENPRSVSMTSHYSTPGNPHLTYTSWTSGSTNTQWHTYGMLWEADKLVFYIDGREYYRVTNKAAVPQEPMYVLSTLALGKPWGNYGPDSSTPNGSTLEIDHITVWQR